MAAKGGFNDELVQRLIAALPAEQREVLALACGRNLTYQQAADVIGVSIEVVIARLLEARRTLIAAMDGDDVC